MSIEDLNAFIARHADRADFVGPRTDEQLQAAERSLGVRLPVSYREFLRAYGGGNLGAEEFFGITDVGESVPDSVWYTLEARRRGLPHSLIVVWDAGDEQIYCIDTSQSDADGESPVVEWVPGLPPASQDLTPKFPTFADFALSKLTDLAEEESW